MTISFNEIPSDRRVPFAYVEFDNANAVQGPQNQPYKIIHIGQKLAAGSQAALEPTQITSADQAGEKFGFGSVLHKMLEGQFEVNKSTETWAVALADDNAGVKASGSFAFSGTASESGVVYCYIGGERIKVGVTAGDSAATVATALKAALDDEEALPVTNSKSSGTVNVIAANAGVLGNYIDLRDSYYDGETVPAGLTLTITPMASGAANPDISDAFAVLGDGQYNVVITPYTDQTNLTATDDELEDRWGPLTQNDGHAITASNLSYSALNTLGNANNSKHFSLVSCTDFPTLPWFIAGNVGGLVAYYGAIDPARPFQTLQLQGVLAPSANDRLTADERNIQLFDGISTLMIDAAGAVRIERLITTYKTNGFGAADTSYLDVPPKLTLSYIRYDFRNYILRKYPRHKLADDGTRFGPGQAIVTPKQVKAEILTRYREWELRGLVEDYDTFKSNLIVERNQSDRNRLDILLPPDLVNQLLITATKIAFVV
jgi:phage tail sheath gpL-like